MTLNILLIILGSVTTIILAFVSYNATRKLVRLLFWISLISTVGIVIYSGISGIRQGKQIEWLNSEVDKYKPFQLLEADKVKLKRSIQDLVELEKVNGGIIPEIHILTFPSQSKDASEFQNFLKVAIESTGRKTIPHHNLGVTGTHLDGKPWDGVIVQVNSLKNPPLFGSGLFKILNELNIKTWSKEGSDYGNNDILIYSNIPSYRNAKK